MTRQHAARSYIARVSRGLWGALNFTRIMVMNLIFVAVLILLLVVFLSREKQHQVENKTTLVLDLQGALVEQFTSDPMSRAVSQFAGGSQEPEVRLRDVLMALDHAQRDPRITQVYLRTDGLTQASLAPLREVAKAIRGVKSSGKKVTAYADHMDQKQYLLASEATEVFLHPSGSIMLEGLGRYRQYYREALQDKLGVDVHLFRVGEFKSAAEPYILDAASTASKESDRFWMLDLWNRYLVDIGAARKIKPQVIQNVIDNFPAVVKAEKGDMAQLALNQKWVDGLKTQEDVENGLIDTGSFDQQTETYRQVSVDNYVAEIKTRQPSPSSIIAIVVAQGEISDGEQGPGGVGGVSTSRLLREAREDPRVKAVVLRVDSPGGGVFASEQIRHEIEMIQKSGRPVVASMGGIAASGGYWISMNADKIIAEPSTITGSIGVFGLVPNVARALDKLGVHTDGVGTTNMAGSFDMTKPLDPAFGSMTQSIIDHGYQEFISKVADARHKKVEQIDLLARGRVWSGAQAKERGLVDELGGLSDAIFAARQLAQLKAVDSRVVYVEEEASPFARWISDMSAQSFLAQSFAKMGVWGAAQTVMDSKQVQSDMTVLTSAMKPGKPPQVFVHCLCGL